MTVKKQVFNKDTIKKTNNKKDNKVSEKIVIYKEGMNISELSSQLNVTNAVVIKTLMGLGIMASINISLDRDTVELVAMELGYKIKDEVISDLLRYDEFKIDEKEEDLIQRPPIVTVMGHVDHGKTTLLDAIRKSRLSQGEAGGITQHIGAYQVSRGNKKITFIDTPGHAAFTQMRKRGAKITDIVVLVVAADDGVMPQTIEAIDHAKAAETSIIVAINKIDKQGANVENIMSELSNYGLLPEKWGGETPYVEVSALKGEGISELLDIIELVSEIKGFKANPKSNARGSVIEAKLDKGKGPVATLIIENGTLKIGDNIVIGNTYGKIRTMEDDLHRKYKEAEPSMAIEVTGINSIPKAGDIFMVFKDEKITRQIAESRLANIKDGELKQKKASFDSMFNKVDDQSKELKLLIKSDVQGSIEALRNVLENIAVEGVKITIIRASVGAITENDISLASASNAIVIGFNVRPTNNVREIATKEGVEIRLYNIIYRISEDIEKSLKGMLEPTYEEKIIGQAEVRNIFKASKIGTIAGSYVTDGFIKNDSLVKIIRDGIVVYEGKIASLKRFKNDVKDVKQGYECGISIANFDDIKVGDIIEASELKEVEEL